MNEDVKNSEQPKEMTFHYLKTNNYQTSHVDGAYGGLCPNGNIYIELFVERYPTPKQVTHKVENNGQLGPEVSKVGKEGMIREIQSGLVMDVRTAIQLRDWLTIKIDQTKILK